MKMPSMLEFLGLSNSSINRVIETPVDDAPRPTPESLGEKKVLMTWKSPSRPNRSRFSQKFIKTGIVIAVVIGLLLVIMQEFFLILVVGSLVFVTYILSNAPVEDVENELSTHGVQTAGVMYHWYDLSRFFFKNVESTHILAIDTKRGLPGRLFISYKPEDHDKIRDILAKYLQYLSTEPMTLMDKAYYKVVDKLNFEEK